MSTIEMSAPAVIGKGAPTSGLGIAKEATADAKGTGKAARLTYMADKKHAVLEHKRVGLGVLGGVFIPTMNSIFGVITFLRWGWAVGQGGIGHAFIIVCIGCVVAVITSLSVAALATNEVVGAGGAYFMISRSLGPAIGGSMGVLFWLAQALSVGFYCLGFSETIVVTFGVSWFPRQDSNTICIGLMTAVTVWILALAGNAIFAKVGTFILAGIVFSLVMAIISIYAQPVSDKLYSEGFRGPNLDTLKANWGPGYAEGYNFLAVFSVVYPSMTAILTGANMSGVLANPGYAIPVGTFLAVCAMVFAFGTVIISLGVSVDRHTLQTNYYIFQTICVVKEFVLIGTLLATYSSALSGFVGVARVFQAMTRDKIFGMKMTYFGVEQGKRELMPRRSMFLTLFMAMAVCFMGDVNAVAPFLSNFMLITFASLNAAALILDISHTPNYRPTFKGCNWKISLVGAIICLIVMLMLDWIKGILSLLLALIIFVVLIKIPPKVNWGSPAQAVLYRVVKGYIMRLDFTPPPVKFWRPKILCLAEETYEDVGLIGFANACRKRGLLVVGHVMVGMPKDLFQRKKKMLIDATRFLREKRKVHGFVEICIAPSLTAGTISMLQLCGLGSMKPNTVVLGLPNHPDFDSEPGKAKIMDWWHCTRGTLELGLNCIVACGLKHFNKEEYVSTLKTQRPTETPTIDVWLSGVGGYEGPNAYALFASHTVCVLQLAYLFSLNPFYAKHTTLRVILLLPGDTVEEAEGLARGFKELMEKVRLTAPIKILCTGEAEDIMKEMELGPDDDDDDKKKERRQSFSAASPAALNGDVDDDDAEQEQEEEPATRVDASLRARKTQRKRAEKKGLLGESDDNDELEFKGTAKPKKPTSASASASAAASGDHSDNEDGGGVGANEAHEEESDEEPTAFDRLSLKNRTRVLNAMMQRHSENTAMIFVQPAVSVLTYGIGLAGVETFLEHQQILCEQLCPVAVVMPSDSQVDERVPTGEEEPATLLVPTVPAAPADTPDV